MLRCRVSSGGRGLGGRARQELPELGTNHARYEYDMVSGNLKLLAYNEAWTDRFFQRYGYDEDNRLLELTVVKAESVVSVRVCKQGELSWQC